MILFGFLIEKVLYCSVAKGSNREKTKNGVTMKLTEKKIIEILENNSIENCTKSEKSQVFKYAFGEEFMDSDDKGTLKQYNN